MSPEVAHFGRGAMSDLSPLCEAKRTLAYPDIRKNPAGPRRGAVRESDARSHTPRSIEYATIRLVSAVCRLGVRVRNPARAAYRSPRGATGAGRAMALEHGYGTTGKENSV